MYKSRRPSFLIHPDLEARLAAALAETDTARQEATDKAVEIGRVTGEIEALRK